MSQETTIFAKLRSVDVDAFYDKFKNNPNFGPISEDFASALKMLLDVGDIVQAENSAIPNVYLASAIEHARQFYHEYSNLILNVSPNIYAVDNFNRYLTTFLTDKVGNINYRFIDIYSAIMAFKTKVYSFENLNIIEEKFLKQLELSAQAEDEYSLRLNKLTDLATTIEAQGRRLSAEEYADIFETEATSQGKNSLGWMAGAALFTIVLIVIVINEDRILPIKENEYRNTVLALDYLKRLLILSFNVYLITFCLKQFSIKKHLQTLNKHRSNTLNSFKLFINSMGTSNEAITITLMQEIARAIYESGQTGYVNLKDDGGGTNTITEVTKFLQNKG